jgi:hypothetical protein
MIHTDGRPTIAMRGSLPGERPVIVKRKPTFEERIAAARARRKAEREVARAITRSVWRIP